MRFRNAVLSALSKADLAALSPHLTEIYLNKSDVLLEDGERVTDVYFPSSAVISQAVVLADGRMVEVSTVGVEGVVGVLQCLIDAPATAQAFAQIPGGAVKLKASLLRQQALASPSLLNLLHRRIAAANIQAEQGSACNALHPAPGRLARWLLMTEDRVGGSEFALTQDYMAVMVGVQRTTISATALQLREKGLIRYSRGQVRILDRKGLEAEACECYALIHEHTRLVGVDDPALPV
ncbi:MAG TPA: Crp/Fnr family transcriptional regulator [Caulobacteraceae bacterium]|jgi:CRP-like cAMP-binding protein